MQKLADGQDTEVGSSPPWLWSRCVAAPHAGAALDCGVAGWPPAGELAPGSGGADGDLLHPVAAPISRMNTQAKASPSRLVPCGRADGDVPVNEARHASVILPVCLVPTVSSSPFRYQASCSQAMSKPVALLGFLPSN
jgi:hypothetical protein